MKGTPLRSGSGRERTSSGRAVPVLISVFIVTAVSSELLAAGGEGCIGSTDHHGETRQPHVEH
jgi:hypothetical protein